MFDTARLRLTLWFGGVFAVILIVIGAAVLFAARTALYDQVEDQLRTRSGALVRSLGGPFDPGGREVLRFASAGGYFFAVTGPEGNVLQGSAGTEELDFPTRDELEAATTDGPAFVDAQTADGDDLRIYVEPVSGVGGSTYFFQVGRSIEPEQAALRRLFFIMGAGGLAGLLLAGLSGYWLAGRALRPIRQSVDAQRTFVADASHELRTPLTLIRANAEVMKFEAGPGGRTEGLDDIIKETDRLSYLVGQMLTLARVDSAGVDMKKEPVDLGAVVRDIARQMRLLAREKGVELEVESGTATVLGDEQRLGELAIILMDNAIKYTDRGGTITAALSKEAGRVRFTVEDTGKGIPPESMDRVFERFYRVDKGRSRESGGTGLGLPIAKWIVDSHSGTIEIESEVGKGTKVTVVVSEAPDVLGGDEVSVLEESGARSRELESST